MTEPPSVLNGEGRLKANWIYLDASIYRALQFDWNGRWLSALVDLADRGLVRVVVTEITRREVKTLMRELWSEANKSLQRSAIVLAQIGLPDTVSLMADKEACVAKMDAAFERWLRRCSVWTCTYEPDLTKIMDDYFCGRPPFGVGRKKAEFPDAIAASMLRNWCVATKQSVYVVSQDGDLKACCSPDGPLIHAISVGEVVSHGTASVKIHDAVTAEIQDSSWLFTIIQCCITSAEINIDSGYRSGGRVEITVESSQLKDIGVNEVLVDEFDGTQMTCDVSLTGDISLKVRVVQEAVQYSEDEWDPGSSFVTWLTVTVDLNANVTAKVAPDGIIELVDASLRERRINLPWDDVERVLD